MFAKQGGPVSLFLCQDCQEQLGDENRDMKRDSAQNAAIPACFMQSTLKLFETACNPLSFCSLHVT